VLPLETLIPELEARGIEVVVDGAHAPGMLDLDIEALAPAWYTANCHKWLCAPKSAGFLWARGDVIEHTRSAIVSHGAGVEDPLARFRAEFDWPGTVDPTAALSVPAAIETMGGLLPGGWDALRARNHALCVEGRRLLCEALEIDPPCADRMIGSMATLPLPESSAATGPSARSALERDPLRSRLLAEDGIEVPILACDAHPGRLVRVSAAAYNEIDDFEALAAALRRHLFP
jgi:isopenicillin-N epimerase